MHNSEAVSFMNTVCCVGPHVNCMHFNSNFIVSDIPGAFQGKRSGVTPQLPLQQFISSFNCMVLLLYTLVMLMSLELELTSLSEETPLSPQSLQG